METPQITQLSLFLENKPGHIRSVCETLATNDINIEAIALADTEQFGILRLLVRDWERAAAVLTQAHFVVKETKVVAVQVEDKPGGVIKILETIDKAKLNIEYMYGMKSHHIGTTILVFRFDNPDIATVKLRENGISLVTPADMFDEFRIPY